MAPVLAQHLARLAQALESRSGCGLSSRETVAAAAELTLLAQLARSQEQELAVHRLAEADRTNRAAMELEATKALDELIADPGGVIIRPDFRRGS